MMIKGTHKKHRLQHLMRSRRGAASALIILLLVLLVFFGVLSLVTAAADLRLAQKRAKWAEDFYMADAVAESVYSGLSSYLQTEAIASGEPRQIVQLINSRLEKTSGVAKKEIRLSGSAIRIELLAAADEDKGQGIAMTLVYEDGQLKIHEWIQWQAPLQAPPDKENIWGGE